MDCREQQRSRFVRASGLQELTQKFELVYNWIWSTCNGKSNRVLGYNKISVVICGRVLRKGVISRAGRIFVLNRAYLQGCSSYNLQTWCNDSPIIVLHSLKISCPTHFWYGRGDRPYCMRSKIGRFIPHFGAPPFQVRT